MNTTIQEIIDETVDYYRNNPRGMSEFEGCMYLTPDGNVCSIGRCMIDPQDGQREIGDLSLTDADSSELDILLKPRYRGHNLVFWCDLQSFHDDSSNWETEKGGELTEQGLKEVADLIEAHC